MKTYSKPEVEVIEFVTNAVLFQGGDTDVTYGVDDGNDEG